MESYPCNGPIGRLLSISMNVDREGAQVDKGRIETLAHTLGFQMFKCYDYSAAKLKKYIRSFAEHRDHSEQDSVLCFVSAHGDTDERGDGYIVDNEGVKLYVFEDIMKPILVSKPLQNKPKVFFVNACRGELDPRKATQSLQSTGMERMTSHLRDMFDVFTVFSTNVGYKSMRCPENGSLFIAALTEIVAKHHNDQDVASMMTILNDYLKEDNPASQIADVHTKLTKQLYWWQRKHDNAESEQQPVPSQVFGQKKYFDKLKTGLLGESEKVFGITGDPIFGVFGMGGIGKTTLAKTICNDRDIQKHFKNHVYWLLVNRKPDIREKQKALVIMMHGIIPLSLDEELLRVTIRGRFRSLQRFLLILDDVWSRNDIDDIVGKPLAQIIPHGSACLITSRIPDELKDLTPNESQKVQLDLLNNNDSRSLFCSYAFKGSEIPHDLASAVEEIIKTCANLPLLLEVIGAQMFGIKTIAEWGVVCNRLKTTGALHGERYERALEILKVSYDSLPQDPRDDLQGRFLDFAAFPEREDIEIGQILDLWTTPSFTEDEAFFLLKKLEGRCMIKMTEHWCFMHDLWRRLAIGIVEEKELRFRKRLYAGHNLKEFPSEWYETQNLTIPRLLQNVSPYLLRCLTWWIDGDAYAVEKLTLMNSRLCIVPRNAFPFFRCLTHLKVLIISYNLNLKQLPSDMFLDLEGLEKLDLSWCLDLSSLPAGIKYLKNLRKLDLTGCMSLVVLPPQIGNLRKLVELILRSTGIMQLPASIGGCINLKILCVGFCSNLSTLPVEIEKLHHLEYLDASVTDIRELPQEVGNLQNLQYMTFSCGALTCIPSEVGNLSNLLLLRLDNNWGLTEIPQTIGRLAEKKLKEFHYDGSGVPENNIPQSLVNLAKDISEISEPSGRLLKTFKQKEGRNMRHGLASAIAVAQAEPFESPRMKIILRMLHSLPGDVLAERLAIKSGCLNLLLKCMGSDNADLSSQATMTVTNLCTCSIIHDTFKLAGGMDVLAKVIAKGFEGGRHALEALLWISNHDKERQEDDRIIPIDYRASFDEHQEEFEERCGCLTCLFFRYAQLDHTKNIKAGRHGIEEEWLHNTEKKWNEKNEGRSGVEDIAEITVQELCERYMAGCLHRNLRNLRFKTGFPYDG